jgi:hypothetical protein
MRIIGLQIICSKLNKLWINVELEFKTAHRSSKRRLFHYEGANEPIEDAKENFRINCF